MKIITKKGIASFAALTIGSLIGTAKAQVILDFNQIGNDVVLTSSGTVDVGTASFTGETFTSGSFVRFGGYTGSNETLERYTGVDLLTTSGLSSIAATPPTSQTGDSFHIFEGSLGFVDRVDGVAPTNTFISPVFTATFSGHTYASLGLSHHAQDVAIDLWGADGDPNIDEKIQFRINSIPEPSSALLLGLAGMVMISRRRRS